MLMPNLTVGVAETSGNPRSEENTATINFEARLLKIGAWTLLRLPRGASAKLPSRGMVMAKGTINGLYFQAALEPDGKGGHWLKVDSAMRKAIRADAGDTAALAIEPIKKWPEPRVPDDLRKALAADRRGHDLWMDITPNARWDWIRWINATKNPETRGIRIEKTLSKLKSGKRTACCFNRSQCTEPEVSKNGVLLEPQR
jgi:Domain of unknown function (DUF1905)/Bacteriocin-protection, YdeI or OmpD-Associated